MAESKKLFVTAEKLQEMQAELDDLVTVKRKEVSEKIKEALAYGDISENAEYSEARDNQAMIEARIRDLENSIRNAEVFKEHKGTAKETKSITIGSIVTLQQKHKKDTVEYTIVGSAEANPAEGKISNEAPLGSAILAKSVGETVTLETPSGEVTYTINSAR